MGCNRRIFTRAGRSFGVWSSGSKWISSTSRSSFASVRLLCYHLQTTPPTIGKIPGSVYWQPVYHVLVGTVEVYIGNAHELRSRPGKKTDKRDAAWIAELLAHGLIQPSFVPPPDIGALRDVTRTRVAFVQTRSQSKNRVHKLLEDTNLKLGSVVSDLFGVTGRRMLAVLVAGERDPQV